MSKARKNSRKRFVDELTRRDGDKIDMRMAEKQAHEFFAGIAGCANNRDLDRLAAFHNAQCVFRLDAIATKVFSETG